jgi:L-alanine-DL-glutamate epimerase-like enolase superfamily enzyme
MIVTDLEAFDVPYVENNDAGTTRHTCLVKVSTDEGIDGWGEAVTIAPEAAASTAVLVRGLREVVLGAPATVDDVRDLLLRRMWWYGRAGGAAFALAAIDTALWDIRGKSEGRPLVDLLGGSAHGSLPIVITSHAVRGNLDAMADEWAGWCTSAAGVGVKVGIGKSGDAHLGVEHDRDVRFFTALRRALGPSAQIMIDIAPNLRWDLDTAIKRTRAFAELGLSWIEEPLGDDDPAGYAALRAATEARIGYGEREWNVRGIRRIVETGTVDVVGMDPGRLEGVSGFADAAAFVTAAGAQVNAHAFSGPITYAAALALSIACPSARLLEVPPVLNELYDILGVPPRPESGRVRAFSGPGLGITVDEKAVRAHAC